MKQLVLALALAAACSAPKDPGVVLWHSYIGAERQVLEAAAGRWNSAHPDKPLSLVFVPNENFADKLSQAIPRGNGPDLFIIAHDRIGNWVETGLLEPIEYWVDDTLADRFSDRALGAMAYGSSLYGLPLAEKSLVLFYRTDVIAQPPRTTDELLALGNGTDPVLAYSNIDLYGHAPWLHGFGGHVMDDSGKLEIATPEAAHAIEFARQLVTRKLVPKDAQDTQVQALFLDKKVGMVLQGPWFLPLITDDVPWKVAPLPIVSATGKPAAPFESVEGVLMSANAHDKQAAFAVIDELTSDANAAERAKLAHQIVANTHTWQDPALASDPVMSVFRAQLAHSVTMPKAEAMRTVWTPYRTALDNSIDGGADPTEQLLKVEDQVRRYAEKR